MRQAIRQNPGKQAVSLSGSIPAPMGGWNTMAPLADMDPSYAVILTNMIPRAGYCEARGGSILRNPGIVGDVDSLMVWDGGAVGAQMFAAAGAKIYNVTAPGTATATTIVSATSARWQNTMFGNDAGQFLVCVNGKDSGEQYDGSAWTAFSISSSLTALSITSAQVDNVMSHMSRCWYAEAGQLRVWYTGIAAFGATCGLLDLGPVFTEGGYITNMASWAINGGNGPQNYALFGTNKGQIAAYQGTDPNDPTNWSIIGTFKLGNFPGQRAFTKIGGDIGIPCSQGAIPLSQVMATNFNLPQQVALTLIIAPTFSQAVQTYGSQFGWEGVNYTYGSLLIFNIPVLEHSTSVQFVQSQLTGGWCLFTGWNANCFAQMNTNLFFGGHNGVFQADVGSMDVDQPIIAECKTAFNYLNQRGKIKHVNMVRPVMNLSQNLFTRGAINIDMDFQNSNPTAVPTVPRLAAGLWDVAEWGLSQWGNSSQILNNWTGANGIGYAASAHMRFLISSAVRVTCQLISFDLNYQGGDLL